MSREILIAIYAIVLFVMISLSFFFSSSDMAYGSINPLRYDLITDKKQQKRIARAKKLTVNYDKTISTILLLNDTINACLDSVATLLGVNLCYLILGGDETNIISIAETWGFVASMIILIIKITIGEIIAKSLGKIYNLKMTLMYSKVINCLNYILTPITFVVSSFGSLIAYPFNKNIEDIEVVEDDLHEMVDDIEKQGTLDEEEAEIIHDAITYTTTEAYEIMTPRVDMYALDIEDDIEESLNNPNLFKYSRVPVFKDTIDNIIGYVSTKELMILKLKKEPIDLKKLLIEPLRFPRSAEINNILKVFKKEKKHFALIIDEYGGIEGILTMEDILEEIVGDIWDEKDDVDAMYSIRKDGSYIVDGSFNLEDFCKLFSIDYEDIDTEYVTIGGYCIELLDDNFAKLGDEVELSGYKLKVLALDKNQSIEKLLVTKIKKEEDN